MLFVGVRKYGPEAKNPPEKHTKKGLCVLPYLYVRSSVLPSLYLSSYVYWSSVPHLYVHLSVLPKSYLLPKFYVPQFQFLAPDPIWQ